MNKENVPVGGLSAEQRARISQNFRAAKALLDRKRPREIIKTSHQSPRKNRDADRVEALDQISSMKKIPLLEIPINTSITSVKGLKIIDSECKSSLCSGGMCADKFNVSFTARRMEVAMEKGTAQNLFRTPVKQLECSSSSCSDGTFANRTEPIDGSLSERDMGVPMENGFRSNSCITPMRLVDSYSLNESFTLRGGLDEDIDESIFKAIDALCEQKSMVKPERDGCTSNFSIVSQSVAKSSCKDITEKDSGVLMELLTTECNLDSSNEQECGAAGSRTLGVKQSGSMPEEYAKYMKSLNDRQREAACSDISVPLMIVAGPGSGKTSTMVGRILMLLNEGIGPSHILAMTFTTAAASEMRDRIGAVAGKATAKELPISTFHSFSLQLCRSHAEKLDRTPEFLIFGNGQQRRAIIEAVRLLENGKSMQIHDASKLGEESSAINSPQYFKDKSKKWQTFVTRAKASGKTPQDCHETGDETGAAILQHYNDILRSCNALDYHDLISCSVKLLTDFSEVFKGCQESWKAIVIDEFQDTSAMQYGLLRILASHKRITIVGDEDQSIFSFNGADISGFDSFRKDFPDHKEIRLNKNYRSTRCIVEAATSLIQNNLRRCQLKNVLTDNSCGSKIIVKECYNEDAQCGFVLDKILEFTSEGSSAKCSFGNVAVLYRRQVSGKVFQTAFRDRKIPFNMHGVAFYRKKVVRAIVAMLRTTLPDCDDGPFRQVFKALLPFEKEEKKKIIEHIDKISTTRKCSYISAAHDIFSAKVSGTFKRSQLTQGRKVLSTLDMISKLVRREQSISAVITSVANMIPQKYLLEQRAVLDVDGGKLLNEDNDLRPVLQYLLDDVSDILSTQHVAIEGEQTLVAEDTGCLNVLKAFIDYISERERENFRSRRHDNEDSVTLTTIHQSKGLEWDTVFIVKANESEIPLLHEFNGVTKDNNNLIEEERRLLYVAMTRAQKKLYILYVLMNKSWQMLQPSRFLKEIPDHLQEGQDELGLKELQTKHQQIPNGTAKSTGCLSREMESSKADAVPYESVKNQYDEASKDSMESFNGNNFIRRFSVEDRAVVSHLFHQWAKKPAFQDPKRLIDKVSFVIDERLRVKKSTHKDVLRSLKSCLRCDEAFHYAEYVLRWERIPADKRAHLMKEKQEHFQKLRVEKAMGSSAATSKQIAYLQNLGCTVVPTSRLHASHLIEQYKSV